MKHIVFCADGTWNGKAVDDDDDGKLETTNVLKLFHLLEGATSIETRLLSEEDEKRLVRDGKTLQVAKYIHGVGDSRNPISRILGGGLGMGLTKRIVRGYTFICRNYTPGDRIVIIGFSRGSYAARALGGMIASVGLLNSDSLDLGDREMAYAMGMTAWREYRRREAEKQEDRSLRERLADLVCSLPAFTRIPVREEDMRRDVAIDTIAVFDTVGALGIPDFGDDPQCFDAYRFADDVLSPKVSCGLHAVSMHERRQTFRPTLWRARAGIKQVRFPGAHSDVGGGYPDDECGLSNGALRWMYGELAQREVRFKPYPNHLAPDPGCEHHEPWKEGLFAKLENKARIWSGYPLEDHESLRKHACARDHH